MTVAQMAKIVHELNRQYCLALGDDSQPPWEEAPLWQTESALSGVEFHLNNRDASARHSHNAWLAEKKEQGWVYGPEKDAALKTHPCIVPFEELPLEQQLKDVLFAQTVRILSLL